MPPIVSRGRGWLSVAALILLLATASAGDGERDGTAKTAIVAFPEFFCSWTELSTPFAYVAFAFEIDGRLAYFHTRTSCADFEHFSAAARRPIFGERVTLYGDGRPTRVRRADGTLYDLVPGQPIRSLFKAGAGAGPAGTPVWADSPNPKLLEAECRKLVEETERNACLRYVEADAP